MSLQRLLASLAVTLTLPAIAYAYKVSGTVVDETNDPMAQASIRLLTERDSAFVKGCAANVNGKFVISDVKSGKYIVESTYVGFAKQYTNVTVGQANVDMPKIVMYESSHMLAEAVVTGVKTPIKVMQDTIEFNADSYKTQPNAVVEDLLKRLPGVEVDSDGKITANGKEVTKILVDGKEFFADDPKVASKNLPVNMVDKLQVVERKSDLARLTGVDDGDDETVINLTVRKGMQNGWFGTVEAGYGTDDRYQATFNVNRFWNGNQLTFIGSANNTNDLGFTDGNGSRFRRFGGDQGINNSQSFGINFNVGKDELIRVGGDVMYSHTDKDTRQRTLREYLLDVDSYSQRSITNTNDRGHNVRADFRIEWKPDSFNTFDFRPNFSYNQNDSKSEAFSISEGKNTSLNRSTADGKSYEVGGRLIYNHNFKSHRGRSISLFANYNMSNVREHDDSYAYNLFTQLDSLDVYDQYTNNHTWTNRINARVTWTEPIGNVRNGNFITVGYGINYRWNNADKLVYDRQVSPTSDSFWNFVLFNENYQLPAYDIDTESSELNSSLSNRFRNTTFQQDIRLGYKKVNKAYTLEAGLSLVPITSQSTNLINSAKNIPSRSVWNLAPFLRLKYKFSKTSSLNVDYFGRSSQPSMTQLQPVADYSDPLNIVVGNPELVPTFNHNIRLRHQDFNAEHQRSIMTMLDAQISQRSIISKTTYDTTTGGRTTTYENVNGVWNARLMNMFSQPLSNKAWTFNNNVFANYSQTVGYNNGLRNRSGALGVAESFSFAFRPDNLELELRPNYYFQTTHNSISSIDNTTIHRYGGSFNGTYYAPFGIVLATDLTFSATRGYAAGYDTDSWMWNASISYQFLAGKAATIQLKAYDLLQQKKDINRTITASYIDDTEYNALTRYFMLSFTYRFNTFGKGNEPSSRNDRFGPPGGGPGGPGGGGRPGGGPR
jgi:hypothetical protein